MVIRLPEHKRLPVEEKIPYFQPDTGLIPSNIAPFEGLLSLILMKAPTGIGPVINSFNEIILLQELGMGTCIFSTQPLAYSLSFRIIQMIKIYNE
jgi:hypothetical protein